MASASTATPVAPKDPLLYEGKAKKRVFNLDKMEKESIEAPYSVKLTGDVNDLREKYTSEDLLKIVQLGEKRKAVLDAKRSIQGVDASIISKTIAPMRNFPQFVNYVTEDMTDDQKSAGRKKQSAEIMAWLKGQPEMWTALVGAAKAQAESASPSDDDEDENDED